jgi:arylsulfatase
MSAMNRRSMLQIMGAASLGGMLPSLGWAGDGEASAKDRPNILVIMVDDMGYSDLGCYGGEIQTPNLDALAANGVRFTRFYNTSRCCPSRACILTGLYPHQTGLGSFLGEPYGPIEKYPGYQGSMVHPNVTMAEILSPAGYATGHIGKWHVGPGGPAQRGFEFAYIGHHASVGCWHYFSKKYGPTAYCTDWLGHQLVRHISSSKEAGKPFFAYWAPTAPHWPIDAKAADVAKYEGVYDKGPIAIAEARMAKMRELGIMEKEMPWHGLKFMKEQDPSKEKHRWKRKQVEGHNAWRKKLLAYRPSIMTEVEFNTTGKPRRAKSLAEGMQAYAAQVDCMDQNVGKVVAKLKELGQFENTLILFCSDNGASRENHWKFPGASTGHAFAQVSNMPFPGCKMSSHDGGVGTPLIMHWPKRIAAEARGSINHTVGHLIDIMPTVLDAAEATYPRQDLKGRDLPVSDGRSLLPALKGNHVPLKNPVFIEHVGNCALIEEDWKLVANDGNSEKPWALFNMKTDRCETRNVANEHPDVVERMDKEWHAIAKRVGARRTGKHDPTWTKEDKRKWAGEVYRRRQEAKRKKQEQKKAAGR